MNLLPAIRPPHTLVVPDGRRLYPCGCIDVPDDRTRLAKRPFVICAGQFTRRCDRRAVA